MSSSPLEYPGQHVTYEWAGEPHASESIKLVDGVEVARNRDLPLIHGSTAAIFADREYPRPGEVLMTATGGTSSAVPRIQRVSVNDTTPAISPGQGYALAVEVKHSRAMPVRIRAWIMDADGSHIRNLDGSYVESTHYGRSVISGVAPEGAAYLGLQIAVDSTTDHGPTQAGDVFGAMNLHVAIAATEREALDQVAEYFDGDTPDGVHPFTWDWWERLPRHVRDADKHQAPEPYPLLRFLDGIGQQAGRVRDQNTAMWSGAIFDPETTPDDMLEWVAYLLGFTPAQRGHPAPVLRQSIADHVASGTHSIGTRAHVAAAVRPYLNPGARIQVLASSSALHTLIIGINPDDVPDQNYERLTRQVRAAGVVPAGHALIVQDIRATWDQWEAAAGDTWEEKEQNIRTWQDSDYAGVELQ